MLPFHDIDGKHICNTIWTRKQEKPFGKILQRVLHPMLQQHFCKLKRKRAPFQIYSQPESVFD